MEKLRLEHETRRLELEAQSRGARNENQRSGGVRISSPKIPAFVDGKDSLDSYLLRFERCATIAEWERDNWATQLSPLLSGRALEVYSGLSNEDARNYDKLKVALLKRYDFT